MRPLIKFPISLIAFVVALCGGRKGGIASGATATPSQSHAAPSLGLRGSNDGKVWSNNLAAKLSETVTDFGAEDRGRQVAGLSTYNGRRNI
jgi:hypothetical protein